MRLISFILVLCTLAVTTLPVQARGNVFDEIVSKVRARLGHHDERHTPAVPAIPEHRLRDKWSKSWLPEMPSVVILKPTTHTGENVDDAGSKHHCNECIRWTAHHILKETVNATLTFCASTECPKLKAKCDWIKKNLNFTVGYIAQKIRPVGSGRLFCQGAKKCPIHTKNSTFTGFFQHDENTYGSDESMDHVDDEEMYVGMGEDTTPAASIISNSDDDQSFDEVQNNNNNNSNNNNNNNNELGKDDLMEGQIDQDIRDIQFIANVFPEDFDDSENGIICSGCVHLGAAHIVSSIWAKTAAFCKNPKNPTWAARCEWTFAHKEFSTGYIYAKFTPCKFSYGYCMGKGLCPHPKSSMQSQPVPMFDLNF